MRRFSEARVDEDKLTAQLFEALGSSLDVRTILKEAYPLLTRLIPADYGALGVSSSPEAEGFEWTVAELPEAFFASYSEMAGHDFVRKAVAVKPRVVLRDQDIIARPELEQNPLYRRARELGAPLEQVMAVMLHTDDRWQSGLSLYRDRARPFSDAERARLQRITPALVNAVRNCHQFGVVADWKVALERLLGDSQAAVVLAADDGREIARCDGASELLERWFEPHECRGSRLPRALATAVQQAASTATPATWKLRRPGYRLEVSFAQVTGYFGDSRWLLRLEERAEGDGASAAWRLKLTKREHEVVQAVQQGWDNRMIGDELGCSEATVKRHLSNVYTKLGIKSRTALVVALAESDDQTRPASTRKP
jgi:DNA-binding NarL/FixJ family response regulator